MFRFDFDVLRFGTATVAPPYYD